jgi:hypothetical protein
MAPAEHTVGCLLDVLELGGSVVLEIADKGADRRVVVETVEHPLCRECGFLI